MKKFFQSSMLLILIIWTNRLPAQEDKTSRFADKIKTGWNFGAIPAFTYDSDQGFQYGAAINFYNYGDGKAFPKYKHSLYFEVSRFTKGSGVYRFYYDSEYLIPGIQLIADLSYLPDEAYDFYGFNGYESKYNSSWEEKTSGNYKTSMFYKMQQKLFRFKTDFQGKIGNSNFKWIAGFNLLNYSIGSVDINKLNKGKSDENKIPSPLIQPGLYEKYVAWGIIPSNDAKGGFVPELKGGLVYDTRDFKQNPMRGIWTEAVISTALEFMGAQNNFSKFSFTHRQYFTLIENDLSFAYRINYQQTFAGRVPFYYQNQVISSNLTGSTSTGLGGSKTIRGIKRNRVVGDGYLLTNAEIRWRFARMKLLNQNFYWGINTFVDAGRVTREIEMPDLSQISSSTQADYFNFGREKLHISYGGGLRLVMNYNFVMAIDYGQATDSQDGSRGIYIGLNYLF